MRQFILKILLLGITVCTRQILLCQDTLVNKYGIGEIVPDLMLSKITHYQTSSAKLSDFRGKWLFLDFWHSTCSSCITGMPKMSGFQERFRQHATFILVGLKDDKYNRNIESLYEQVAAKQKLKLISAYDSGYVMAEKLHVETFPHIVIIDPKGIVRHVTNGVDMTEQKLQLLFDGKKVSFRSKNKGQDFEPAIASGKTAGGKKSNRILFNSVLKEWEPGEKQSITVNITDNLKLHQGSFKVSMASLSLLYKFAYFGKIEWESDDSLYDKMSSQLILETKDSAKFEYDKFDLGKNTYDYYLNVPLLEQNAETLMRVMQQELHFAFGYTAAFEKRKVPVWRLIKTSSFSNKIVSNGVRRFYEGGFSGFTIRDYPIDLFVVLIKHGKSLDIPILNETGIAGHISLKFDALMTDWNDVRRELRRHGFDLVNGEKEMKCLVIKDKPNK